MQRTRGRLPRQAGMPPQVSSNPLGSKEEDRRMRWERATIILRLISLIFGVGSLIVAWYLTKISSSGIEDVPPPFILLAGMAGVGFLCIAIIGRFPRPGTTKSIRKRE